MDAQALRGAESGSVEFFTANPQDVRDAVVAFWWERRQWPEWPLEQYYRVWDWRYTSLSDGSPQICVARRVDSGAIVGFVAVYRRTFRLDDTPLAVGVPSSLAVHPDLKGGIAGARLSTFPSRQLGLGRYDVLLAFANRLAHDLFLRLGAEDLGRMASYADVHQAGPMLRRRLAVLAPVGIVLDAGLWMRRRGLGLLRGSAPKMDVHEVTAEEFRRLDRSHWVAARDRVVAMESSDYVVRRYLECPYAQRRIRVLIGSQSGRCEGFVVTEGTENVELWDVQVNDACLGIASAIAQASQAFDNARIVSASVLPGTATARELASAGLFRTWGERRSEYPRFVDGTVRRQHPLEAQLKDFSRWRMWTGTSQY